MIPDLSAEIQMSAKIARSRLMKKKRSSWPGGCSVRADSERGFTLVALAIGIAILVILIAGVAPSVGTIMKREREDELIFRGRQYARAIALFQRRYGRYPNQLKELYENRPRTIRKLWKDPMCSCDFYPLIQGMPDSLPPGQVPVPTTPPGSSPFPPTSTPPAQLTPTASPFSPAPGQDKPIGPIVGVRSTIHKEGLRDWRGSKYYDQWRFIVGDADRDTVGGLPPGGVPGMPQYPPTPPRGRQ